MELIKSNQGMGLIKSNQRIELISPNKGMGLIKSSHDIQLRVIIEHLTECHDS